MGWGFRRARGLEDAKSKLIGGVGQAFPDIFLGLACQRLTRCLGGFTNEGGSRVLFRIEQGVGTKIEAFEAESVSVMLGTGARQRVA